MNEDLLIEEFHDAGLWLPEEIEARDRQRKLDKRRGELFAAQMQAEAGRVLSLPANQFSGQFGPQGLGLLGQQQSGWQLQGGIGLALGGLFGGLR